MKRLLCLKNFLVAACFGFLITPAAAITLATGQFGVATSPAQSTFQLVIPGTTPSPAIFSSAGTADFQTVNGTLLMQISAGSGFTAVDRGLASGDAGTYAHLYESFASTTGQDLRVEVTGLYPNTTYQLQVWSWDRLATSYTTNYRLFQDLAGTSVSDPGTWAGAITATGGGGGVSPSSLASTSSTTFMVTSDASGTVIFGPSRVDAFGQADAVAAHAPLINGFQITVASQPQLSRVLGGGDLDSGDLAGSLAAWNGARLTSTFGTRVECTAYINETTYAPTPQVDDQTIIAYHNMGIQPELLFEYYPNYSPGFTLDSANYQAIGQAFAARFRPNSPWLLSQGIANWGVTTYSFRNEPDNTGYGLIPLADYVNAITKLATGVHSVDPNIRVVPGGLEGPNAQNEGSPSNNFTARGYCSNVKTLLNSGALDGIDLHIYNGSAFGIQPTVLAGAPYNLFAQTKSYSGITRDVNYYSTEWNNTDSSTDDTQNTLDFLNSMWGELTILGNGTPTIDSLRTQAAFPYSLTTIFPTGGQAGSDGLCYTADPLVLDSRGYIYANVGTMLKGMTASAVTQGIVQYQGNGRKLWLLKNYSLMMTPISAYTVTGLPPNTAAVEVWLYNNLEVANPVPNATYAVTGGATSVNITGLPSGQTILLVARPELLGVASRKSHNGKIMDLPVTPTGQGPMTIEPRSNAAGLSVVYHFADQIKAATMNVASGTATLTSVTYSTTAPYEVVANFSAPADQQVLRLRLSGIQTSAGTNVPDVNASLGLLYGDVNGDGVVNAQDAGLANDESPVPLCGFNQTAGTGILHLRIGFINQLADPLVRYPTVAMVSGTYTSQPYFPPGFDWVELHLPSISQTVEFEISNIKTTSGASLPNVFITASIYCAGSTDTLHILSATSSTTAEPTYALTSVRAPMDIDLSGAVDSTDVAAVIAQNGHALQANYYQWAQANFTAADLNDTTVSGPSAKLTSDGQSNLTKFALGFPPKQNIPAASLPQLGASGGNWTYTFAHPANMGNLIYVVEYSSDLISWSSAGVTLARTGTVGSTETWQATLPQVPARKGFFRLRIALP